VPDIKAGDVLCTRATGWAPRLIRLGAAFLDKPDTVNHVAIVHHQDAKGEWVCIEGRPGGVGWSPAAKYLDSPWTLSNAHQPKTDEQRQQIVAASEALLGRPYDWRGIALDAAKAVGINVPARWEGKWNAAQVVCSSLAAYVYNKVGLARPAGDLQTITPGDWADFIITHDFD
jgi:cell wall-associated NlpC family hydrolase